MIKKAAYFLVIHSFSLTCILTLIEHNHLLKGIQVMGHVGGF